MTLFNCLVNKSGADNTRPGVWTTWSVGYWLSVQLNSNKKFSKGRTLAAYDIDDASVNKKFSYIMFEADRVFLFLKLGELQSILYELVTVCVRKLSTDDFLL